jgi:hypothetical protein
MLTAESQGTAATLATQPAVTVDPVPAATLAQVELAATLATLAQAQVELAVTLATQQPAQVELAVTLATRASATITQHLLQ